MLKVNTIYPAFMGEVNCHGIGVPCTFVRLAGCNLRCYVKTKGTTCDTPEALDGSCGDLMDEDDILCKVELLQRKVICLTGGEPLLQDVTKLLEALSVRGYHVVIETNGSQSILPYRHIKNVSFVVDCKSTSSGEHDRMLEANYVLMNKDDYLKFVIDSIDDYVEAKMWLGSHLNFKGNIAFGLFWGSAISYQELMASMIKDKLNVSLNMQTHKMACLHDFVGKDKITEIFVPKNL